MSSSSEIGGRHQIYPCRRSSRYLFALPDAEEHHSTDCRLRRWYLRSRESRGLGYRTLHFRRSCQYYISVRPNCPQGCRCQEQQSCDLFGYWRNDDLRHHREDWLSGSWSWLTVSESTGVESMSWNHHLLRLHVGLPVSIAWELWTEGDSHPGERLVLSVLRSMALAASGSPSSSA